MASNSPQSTAADMEATSRAPFRMPSDSPYLSPQDSSPILEPHPSRCSLSPPPGIDEVCSSSPPLKSFMLPIQHESRSPKLQRSLRQDSPRRQLSPHRCVSSDSDYSNSSCWSEHSHSSEFASPRAPRIHPTAIDASRIPTLVLSNPDLGSQICLATNSARDIARSAASSRGGRQAAEDAAKHMCIRHYNGRRADHWQAAWSWISVLGHMKGRIESTPLHGHEGAVCALISLRDGRFVSGSKDTTVRVWGVHGDCELTLRGHTDAVGMLLQLSATRLLSGSADSTLRIWDLQSGECLKVLQGHFERIRAAVQIGKHLVSGADDSKIRVWTAEGEAVRTVAWPVGGVCSLAYLSAVEFISGGHDGSVCQWNVDGTKVRAFQGHTEVFQGHTETVWTVSVLADGCIMSGSDDQTVRIWKDDGCLSNSLDVSDPDPSRDVILSCVAELSGGRVALGTFEGPIQIWDASAAPAQRLQLLEGHSKMVHAVEQLQDGRILSASRDGTLRIWRDSGECERIFQDDKHPVSFVVQLCDGRVVSSSKAGLAIWA